MYIRYQNNALKFRYIKQTLWVLPLSGLWTTKIPFNSVGNMLRRVRNCRIYYYIKYSVAVSIALVDDRKGTRSSKYGPNLDFGIALRDHNHWLSRITPVKLGVCVCAVLL